MRKLTGMAANPRPVKFTAKMDKFLGQASYQTDLTITDLVRKSVILLQRQRKLSGGWGFIMDLR